MPPAFIRPYTPQDFDAGLHIFNTTISASLDFEPARAIASHIYYRPYVLLSPSTCFVLDDGDGRAVGYIIGTADTEAMIARWAVGYLPVVNARDVPPLRGASTSSLDSTPHLNPGLESKAPQPTSRDGADDPVMAREDIFALRKAVYSAECSMLQHRPELLARYPAHLHVDILPGWQGEGWGARMMGVFLERVRGEGARGVHLGMGRENVGAGRFYAREGFGGVEGGWDGVDGGAVCLVRDL